MEEGPNGLLIIFLGSIVDPEGFITHFFVKNHDVFNDDDIVDYKMSLNTSTVTAPLIAAASKIRSGLYSKMIPLPFRC